MNRSDRTPQSDQFQSLSQLLQELTAFGPFLRALQLIQIPENLGRSFVILRGDEESEARATIRGRPAAAQLEDRPG